MRLCTQIAAAHGLTADVDFNGEYPVTVNDPEHADFALEVAADLFGAERRAHCPDPSWARRTSPGCWMRCRARSCSSAHAPSDDPLTAPTNHSALARFDDTVLPDAALLLAELARQRLARLIP